MADSETEADHTIQELTDESIDRNHYFDYFYDLYEGMHQFKDQNCLLVLDQDNFDDFLGFCLENMNQEIVDADIWSRSGNHNRSTQASLGELSE